MMRSKLYLFLLPALMIAAAAQADQRCVYNTGGSDFVGGRAKATPSEFCFEWKNTSTNGEPVKKLRVDQVYARYTGGVQTDYKIEYFIKPTSQGGSYLAIADSFCDSVQRGLTASFSQKGDFQDRNAKRDEATKGIYVIDEENQNRIAAVTLSCKHIPKSGGGY